MNADLELLVKYLVVQGVKPEEISRHCGFLLERRGWSRSTTFALTLAKLLAEKLARSVEEIAA
jgi:hypothetical protein